MRNQTSKPVVAQGMSDDNLIRLTALVDQLQATVDSLLAAVQVTDRNVRSVHTDLKSLASRFDNHTHDLGIDS